VCVWIKHELLSTKFSYMLKITSCNLSASNTVMKQYSNRKGDTSLVYLNHDGAVAHELELPQHYCTKFSVKVKFPRLFGHRRHPTSLLLICNERFGAYS
jgi:hypothetical protein